MTGLRRASMSIIDWGLLPFGIHPTRRYIQRRGPSEAPVEEAGQQARLPSRHLPASPGVRSNSPLSKRSWPREHIEHPTNQHETPIGPDVDLDREDVRFLTGKRVTARLGAEIVEDVGRAGGRSARLTLR